MPNVIFIEPEYTDSPLSNPNDDHPLLHHKRPRVCQGDLFCANRKSGAMAANDDDRYIRRAWRVLRSCSAPANPTAVKISKDFHNRLGDYGCPRPRLRCLALVEPATSIADPWITHQYFSSWPTNLTGASILRRCFVSTGTSQPAGRHFDLIAAPLPNAAAAGTHSRAGNRVGGSRQAIGARYRRGQKCPSISACG